MDHRLTLPRRFVPLGMGALALASVALTLGFACALPFAAFGAIAALAFDAGAAASLVAGVWLINQFVGFCVMNYPLDDETLLWGGMLGLLGFGALFAARAAQSRLGGFAGAAVAFLAAFAAYEGGLIVIDMALGVDAADYALPVVLRVLEINAAAFGALYAAGLLASRATRDERARAAQNAVS